MTGPVTGPVSEDPLLVVADQLYAVPPPEFTARRDALAQQLRSDKTLAAAVKALRKPSLSAWVVNLLVRREAGQVAEVLSVGEALRAAQESMSGDQLRALTRQRRQLTAAVTTRARVLAGEAGVRVTPAVAEQVEGTLTAAMMDQRAAAAVRSGLLVAPVSATGVEDVEVSVALPQALGFAPTPVEAAEHAERSASSPLRSVPDPDADAKALATARDRLAAADAGLRRAQGALDDAAADVGTREARALQVQAELDELRRRVAELEAAAEEVDDELAEAEELRAHAARALAAATRERDEAAARVRRLES